MLLWCTGADHIGMRTGDTADECITVNGVDYGLRFDAHPEVYLEANGRHALKVGPAGWGVTYNDCHLRRRDSYTKEPSDAAIRKVREALVAFVNTWVETEAGKALLAAGTKAHHEGEVAHARRKVEEATAALAVAQAELDALVI